MNDQTPEAQLATVASDEIEHFAKKREITDYQVMVFARVGNSAAIAVAADQPMDPVDQLLALLMYAKEHADLHGLPFSFNQEAAS